MPILKHIHTRDFTILPNSLIRDPALSLRSVGLLALMLSLPDGWRFSVAGLEKIAPRDGRAAINTAVAEIEAAGYLRRDGQGRGIDRKIGGAVWYVSDAPTVDRFSADGLPVNGETVSGSAVNGKPVASKEKIREETINEKSINKISSRYTLAAAPPTDGHTPTRESIEKLYRNRGYTFDLERFISYNAGKGWKLPVAEAMEKWAARERNTTQAVSESVPTKSTGSTVSVAEYERTKALLARMQASHE
ncbi:MAG: hypothetical protein LUE21_10375 [Oscillospiraceae bacterium]|nr:hypothetical protein [Oscillospiraceae bacterium]